jgi:hypothetical protein
MTFPKTASGIAAKSSAPGKVEVLIINNGRTLCGAEVSASEIGGAVATLLASAIQASSGTVVQEPKSPPLMIVGVSGLGIWPHPTSNHYTLHLQCGEAQIGFELTPALIRLLRDSLNTIVKEMGNLQ